MNETPPPFRPAPTVDEQHLEILAVFHFVVAGIAVMYVAFFVMHYFMMSTIMTGMMATPTFRAQQPNLDPAFFFHNFIWFYLVMGAWNVMTVIANIAGGLCLRGQRHRKFSFFVAGINCIYIPFGTALGVFTILVLRRPSVRGNIPGGQNMSAPSYLPPVPRPPTNDREHMKVLMAFHFVLAGFAVVGMAFLAVHYTIMNVAMTAIAHDPKLRQQDNGFDPLTFIHAFIWLYLFMGGIMLITFVANILSGIFLRQRQQRMFSIVVAGINCLGFPFGTMLGVFTIMVLMRPTVIAEYGETPG